MRAITCLTGGTPSAVGDIETVSCIAGPGLELIPSGTVGCSHSCRVDDS